AKSRRAAAIAAVLSCAFGVVLIVWGVRIQAVSMTGGGVLSVGRGVMAAFILVGIGLAPRRTSTFPLGLYKLENIIAATIGVIVLVLAYELALVSIAHLDGTYIFTNDPKYALPFFVAAALLAATMGLYKRRVSRIEGCPSLEADAYFSFADGVALVIIGVALTLDMAGVPRVDAIAGLIVACFLAVIAYHIFRNALRVLLDASVGRDVLTKAEQLAAADPGIRKVLSVDGRNSGSFIFLHLVVEPVAPDLSAAGDIARDLERRLRNALEDVDSVGIEFGTPTGSISAAIPLDTNNAVSSSFETAPKLAILEFDNGSVTANPEVVDNPALGLSGGSGVYLAVFLGRRSVDVLLVKNAIPDDDVRQTLKAYAIDVRVRPSLTNLADVTAEGIGVETRSAGTV
ncbi:MAG: cation diffusion facilitator family transporter, partial [Actinomycetes bacterium]